MASLHVKNHQLGLPGGHALPRDATFTIRWKNALCRGHVLWLARLLFQVWAHTWHTEGRRKKWHFLIRNSQEWVKSRGKRCTEGTALKANFALGCTLGDCIGLPSSMSALYGVVTSEDSLHLTHCNAVLPTFIQVKSALSSRFGSDFLSLHAKWVPNVHNGVRTEWVGATLSVARYESRPDIETHVTSPNILLWSTTTQT